LLSAIVPSIDPPSIATSLAPRIALRAPIPTGHALRRLSFARRRRFLLLSRLRMTRARSQHHRHQIHPHELLDRHL
jgi:hypothetical protein